GGVSARASEQRRGAPGLDEIPSVHLHSPRLSVGSNLVDLHFAQIVARIESASPDRRIRSPERDGVDAGRRWPPLVLPERPGSSGDTRHAYALPGIFAEANFELIGARRPAPLYAHDPVANRASHPPFLDADGHRREIDFRGQII